MQDRREVVATSSNEQQDTTVSFSPVTNEPSFVLLVMKRDEKLLNTVLYEVALYNFSQFMIKDFDLKQVPMFTIGESAVQVSGFVPESISQMYLSERRNTGSMPG